MATLDDVRRIALGLPDVVEGDDPLGWSVRDKAIAWERPLRPKDLAELGLERQERQERSVRDKAIAWERPLRPKDLAELGLERQERTVLCVRCPQQQKAELVASEPEIFFATSHFNGFPAVLVWLDAIDTDELAEVVTDAWLYRAPKRLAKEFLAGRGGDA